MDPWSPICPPARGLIRPTRIGAPGGPTRGEAGGPRWRRSSYGFYVPAHAPDTVEQRILEQAVRLPTGGAVTGWAACRLHRVGLIDGLDRDGRTPLPVPLIQGPRGRLRAGSAATLLNEPIDPAEVVQRYTVPTTIGLRAAFDATRLAVERREAVVALDAALAAQLTSLARFHAYVAAHAGWRRIELARFAARHGSEESLSPYETRLRLLCLLDARLPSLDVNREIRDAAGRSLGIVDLLDTTTGLAIEFDGADHRNRRQPVRDVSKEDALRRVGLEVVRVTATDMARPPVVVSRVRAARERARRLPSGGWTAHRWRPDCESAIAYREAREAAAD